MSKVLIIGPGRNSNGGISKVISCYQTTDFWKAEDVTWIESHCSGPVAKKLFVLLRGIILFIFALPRAKIAHIHFTGRNSANRKFLFYLMSRLFKIKIVSHVHAPNLGDLADIANFPFIHMIKNSDRVISLAPLWTKALNDIVHREYIVLNNPSAGYCSLSNKKEKIILFAGKLESRKGYIDLINAFARIKERQNYKLILAGDGDIKHARQLIVDLQLQDVEVTGWLQTKEMMALFSRASIFVLPSYGEGFPISIIDAMSNNCAVITTPVGGIPDLLTDAVTCFFVHQGDTDALAAALDELITNDIIRGEIALNGYTLAVRIFDKINITKKLSQIYSELLV